MPARFLVFSLLAAGSAAAQVATPAPAESHPAVRAGVLFSLVSVPRPLSAELFVKLYDLVGVGAGYSALPSAVSDIILSAANVKDATAQSAAIEGEVRIFPFRGSFFVGSSIGRQTLTASATRSGQTVNVDMTTLYAAPRLGWLGIWDSGFSLSFDAGVQLPLSTDATVSGGNPDAKNSAESAARSLGNQPLPSINLRLGFFL
jgi:hypothetical protein